MSKKSTKRALLRSKKKEIGKKKIIFRIKDWAVSSQRYWGCPIPVMYDEEGKAHPVPKETLPVKLPEKIDLNVKGNPLDHQNSWREIKIDGKKFIRETDTSVFKANSYFYILKK